MSINGTKFPRTHNVRLVCAGTILGHSRPLNKREISKRNFSVRMDEMWCEPHHPAPCRPFATSFNRRIQNTRDGLPPPGSSRSTCFVFHQSSIPYWSETIRGYFSSLHLSYQMIRIVCLLTGPSDPNSPKTARIKHSRWPFCQSLFPPVLVR